MQNSRFKTDNPLLFGLAFLAAVGLVIMIVTAAAGVIGGASADSSALGLFFWLGLALLVSGIVGWFGVTRPDKNFDDINQPLEDDHGHGHAHDTDAEHADQNVLPATTSHH